MLIYTGSVIVKIMDSSPYRKAKGGDKPGATSRSNKFDPTESRKRHEMVVAQVSLVPAGTGSASVSEFVVAALKVLDNHPEVNYRLTPMGTIIEADLDDLWPVIREMHEAVFQAGAPRVILDLRIDDRRDKELTMNGKVASVLRQKPDAKVE